ncbi:MAG: hypothetical protein CXR31_05880 [Geobacter sp.]|nr:MAG: hypothetical protein CXR31_05880 [Geobacter sp.]
MSEKRDEKLSAYFHGLIDVCEREDGHLVYLTIEDDLPMFEETTCRSSMEYVPPDKHHFPFTLPRMDKVTEYFDDDDANIYADVLTYLQRFSALDDLQWSVVAHYIFLTYLHDHIHIDYCPYILFYAVPERGKSRTGKSVSYLAFRGVHLIEMREANIFRYSQNLHGTLFFDLMDISKKAEKSGCDDILLLRAEKGAKCVRVIHPEKGAFEDTTYYEIYGPTIIASNEQLHKILETRCLPIIMPNRPGNYENPRPELALELKERLTAWRAKALFTPLPDLHPIEGISGRLWDIAKPLFQVNNLVNPDGCELLQEAILTIAGERSESKKDSTEGHLVGIIKDLSAEKGLEGLQEWTLKTSDILQKFNGERPADKYVSAQWIGKKLKTLSLRHRTVNGRSEIILTFDDYWTLIEQYGVSGRDSGNHKNHPNETLPIRTKQYQGDTGVVGSSRVSAGPWQEKELIESLSTEEQEEFDERVAILIADGRLMPEDAEEEAYNMILRNRKERTQVQSDGGSDGAE